MSKFSQSLRPMPNNQSLRYMNLFAMDQGTLLECFCLHSKKKSVSVHGPCKRSSIKQAVFITIVQCFLVVKSLLSVSFIKTCLHACAFAHQSALF